MTVLAVLALFACQTEPAQETGATEEAVATDTESVRTLIEQNNDRFEQALLAGDAAAMGSFYTDDAVILPPASPRTEGRAAIESTFAEWLGESPPPASFSLTTDDVTLAESGDIAYEVGTFTWSGTTPDGESYDETGKYLVVWENVDGDWRMAADAWNSDTPMHEMKDAATGAEKTGSERTEPAPETESQP